MLATGAFPADHGMVGNIWLDQQSGELTYNIEDSDYEIVGADKFVDKKTEIDPTQKLARTEGRSPRAILASTFSDELLISSNHQAKVFGVSIKDRGAVPLAGHGGKAFWFNKKNGNFISSTYYFEEYPAWVNKWNSKGLADYMMTRKNVGNTSEGPVNTLQGSTALKAMGAVCVRLEFPVNQSSP